MKDIDELRFAHRYEPATQMGAPTLLLLHGAGGDETSLLGLGKAVAPGAALLSAKGKALNHGQARFFSRAGNPSRTDAEIQRAVTELIQFTLCARRYYQCPEPLILAGFSNGANIAVHLLLEPNTCWGGAILMRGMAADDHSPQRDLRALPVLILSGINDPIVQADQAEDLALQLRNAGADVTLHWEQAGHNLCQGDVLMAFDWTRRFYNLKRSSPPAQ